MGGKLCWVCLNKAIRQMKCTLLNALASLHAIGFPFRKPDPCQSQQGVCEAWGWRSGETRPPARVLFPVSFFHTVLHYGAGLPLLGQDGASIDGLVKRFAMLSCFFFWCKEMYSPNDLLWIYIHQEVYP